MGLFSALAHDQYKTEEVYVGSVVQNWKYPPPPKKKKKSTKSYQL